MDGTNSMSDSTAGSRNDYDVVIVGAGLSGIAAAVELRRKCPWARFIILEQMEAHGGTWLSNVYPGVRSDSDMFTFSFSFAPWEDVPIAKGELFQEYMGDVIQEHKLSDRIVYNHKLQHADWREDAKAWELTVEVGEGRSETYRANFLMMCQGYYRQREGHLPEWKNMSAFNGDILQPQKWPEDYDCSGKQIVVIGSGATAATIVPVLAEEAKHVVQLQRSPSYYLPMPNDYPLATQLRELNIPKEWVHEIVRQQISKEVIGRVQYCLDKPEAAKQALLEGVREALGVETIPDDFVPSYNPWEQRACVIPDNDFFEAIKAGKASVRTDEIAEFTANGLKLKSGDEIEADLVIAATGFNINAFGDVKFSKDGQPFDMTSTVTYRGLMFTDTPNFSWTMGYLRSSSYTLRSELVARLIARLLNYMHDNGIVSVAPSLPEELKGEETCPYLEVSNFRPGYVVRARDILPRSLKVDPWCHSQDYWADSVSFTEIDFAEEPLVFDHKVELALSDIQ